MRRAAAPLLLALLCVGSSSRASPPARVRSAACGGSSGDSDQERFLLAFGCVGRLGNQFDQLLATIETAAAVGRTTILPPFVVHGTTEIDRGGAAARSSSNLSPTIPHTPPVHRSLRLPAWTQAATC